MKLVWSPETASKAYISAVRSLSSLPAAEDTAAAELVAALAGGWNSQLTLHAPSPAGAAPAVPAAISAALRHTRGRLVTLGEEGGGESPQAGGVDFMVVDMRRRDAGRLVREAAVGPRGMVVVCLDADGTGTVKAAPSSSSPPPPPPPAAGIVVGKGMRMVRSAYLPICRGVQIFHVGVGKGPRIGGGGGARRWFKHVDRVTGEEHLFRK